MTPKLRAHQVYKDMQNRGCLTDAAVYDLHTAQIKESTMLEELKPDETPVIGKTEMDNLRILATFLAENPKVDFNMGAWRSTPGYWDEDEKEETSYTTMNDVLNPHTCGSAGCALGWAPTALFLAGVLSEDSVKQLSSSTAEFNLLDVQLNGRESTEDPVLAFNIDETNQEFFPVSTKNHLSTTSHFFEWMFGSEWEKADNTPLGAAARIKFVLDNGHPLDTRIMNRLAAGVTDETTEWYREYVPQAVKELLDADTNRKA